MVHFMGSSDSSEVPVVTVAHDFESLVNKNVVHQKITKSINCDTDTHEQAVIITVEHPKKHQQKTRNGENQKEQIVPFEETCMSLMMIPMQQPKEAVHDIFVRKPGHKLHKQEGAYYRNYIY